jgi:hypothetical protein
MADLLNKIGHLIMLALEISGIVLMVNILVKWIGYIVPPVFTDIITIVIALVFMIVGAIIDKKVMGE